MFDTLAIPILVKAIDFLFEEGKTILKERRERRQTKENEQPIPDHDPLVGEKVNADVIQSSDILLKMPIREVAWKDAEKKVSHLLSLLETYKKNYYLAREQYAKYGSADVRPITVHNLTEAEDGIATTMKELQTVLTQIYGKEIKAVQ